MTVLWFPRSLRDKIIYLHEVWQANGLGYGETSTHAPGVHTGWLTWIIPDAPVGWRSGDMPPSSKHYRNFQHPSGTTIKAYEVDA